MEYMGGKEFWHKRFAARSDAPMQPEAILVEDMKKMKQPTAPVGFGVRGREGTLCIWHNWGCRWRRSIFRPTALQRLNRFASRQKSVPAYKADGFIRPERSGAAGQL